MLIGEIVKKTGFSKDTIRFYEKHGLIKIGRKERRENNYKEYSENILEKLLTIRRLKNFGFTLNEVAEFLELLKYNEASCENVSQKITEKITLIDQKLLELLEIKRLMQNGLVICGECCDVKAENENCKVLVI